LRGQGEGSATTGAEAEAQEEAKGGAMTLAEILDQVNDESVSDERLVELLFQCATELEKRTTELSARATKIALEHGVTLRELADARKEHDASIARGQKIIAELQQQLDVLRAEHALCGSKMEHIKFEDDHAA
jgi:hypothetical protein